MYILNESVYHQFPFFWSLAYVYALGQVGSSILNFFPGNFQKVTFNYLKPKTSAE